MLLKEKQNEIQSLKDKIAQVEMAQQVLKENRIQRKKIFTESKHSVQKEVISAYVFYFVCFSR